MADLKNKRIITVATTGAWPTKKNNPTLPTQPDEIVEQIYQCWKLGAAIAHVHIRDEQDGDSLDPKIFAKVVDGLHEKHPDCDVILNLTTAGGVTQPEEARINVVKALKPEMASYDCGTANWMHKWVFNNNTPFLCTLGDTMIELGCKPEVEVFDLAMIHEAKWILDEGHLLHPTHFQFCLGAAGGLPGNIETVLYMRNTLRELIPDATWSAFGTGAASMPTAYAALSAGGNIRIGMEDNVYYRRGQLCEGNPQLIERAARLVTEFGADIATPAEAREMLGLAAK